MSFSVCPVWIFFLKEGGCMIRAAIENVDTADVVSAVGSCV